MSEPMIPTLHLNTNTLFNKSDILTYLLRHYLFVPSGIYENYIHEEISFAKTFAEYSKSIELLKEHISIDLIDVLQRYFGDLPLMIDVTDFSDTEKATTLTIDIQISDNKNTYSVSPNIEIDNQTNKFKINFSDV